MLRIRLLDHRDYPEVRKIHQKHFPELECFLDRPLLSAYVIEDEEDNIILAGGIEGIAEALLMVNRDANRIKIGKALVEAQRYSLFTCGHHNIQELYAFVHDEEYAKHLIQHGFHERTDKVLRMQL